MKRRPPADLASLIANHGIVVCVGSGGVGKTTISAALALWGALQGRHTAVLTIDPAKRLATCLGFAETQKREHLFPPDAFTPYGLSPRGTLTALLVDQPSAWDAAVERYVPTPEVRNRILTNRFYLGLSRTFAGSHEYMALDTLASLVERNLYDLIVVDTPPTKQALDFLEAPHRVQRFLDSQVSRWFIQPSLATGWAAFSAVNRTATFLLRRIEAAAGVAALGEISEFFTAMQHMFADFGHRFMHISEVLAGPETAFVLVTRPEEEVLAEAEKFLASLHRLQVPLKGVVVNGSHEVWRKETVQNGEAKTLIKQLHKILHIRSQKHETLQWLAENFLAYQTLLRGEKNRLQRFRRIFPRPPVFAHVPVLPDFPADLSGLLTLHQYLFGTPRPPSSRRTQAKEEESGKQRRRGATKKKGPPIGHF